jgi:hypothetical protein
MTVLPPIRPANDEERVVAGIAGPVTALLSLLIGAESSEIGRLWFYMGCRAHQTGYREHGC